MSVRVSNRCAPKQLMTALRKFVGDAGYHVGTLLKRNGAWSFHVRPSSSSWAATATVTFDETTCTAHVGGGGLPPRDEDERLFEREIATLIQTIGSAR